MKNLGGNTPSEEVCTVLTIGTEEKEGFAKPLDSRHTREGGRYRKGAAFSALTGWSFSATYLGHPADDRGPLVSDKSTRQLPWTYGDCPYCKVYEMSSQNWLEYGHCDVQEIRNEDEVTLRSPVTSLKRRRKRLRPRSVAPPRQSTANIVP